MSGRPHPEFEAADESHRWTKPLAELGQVLRDRAWKLEGGWVWFVVPHGALVAMRVVPEGGHAFKKQLRIARRGMKDPKGFEFEVRTFIKHLGLEAWGEPEITVDREMDTDTYSGHASLLEPAALGAKQAKCARCGKDVVHDAAFKEDLCTACALEKGNEETAARQQRQAELL
jgi:hypothetical protein